MNFVYLLSSCSELLKTKRPAVELSGVAKEFQRSLLNRSWSGISQSRELR